MQPLVNFLNDPLSFFIHSFQDWDIPAWFSGTVFQTMRTTFLLLDIFLVFIFFIVFIRSWKYRPKLHPKVRVAHKTFTLRDDVFKKRWEGIRTRVDGGTADGIRLAVIEADKLADDALKQMGLEGEHMADRMSHLSDGEVRTLERLWRAHRVRNDLVHSPGFSLSATDGKRIVEDYEAFLKEVHVLGGEGSKH